MRIPLLPWILVATVSLMLSAALVNSWEAANLSLKAKDGLYLHGYAYADASDGKKYRKIVQREGMTISEYRFMNFNNDLIQVEFSQPSDQLEEYRKGYGYTQDDLEGLKEWQKKALKDAYQDVVDHSLSQSDLDRMGAEIKDEYRRKLHDLMISRGFKYKTEGMLVPDIPGIAKRNVANLSPVALDIDKIAKSRNYDALDIVGANLSLVQTGLEYERIPMKEGNRTIGGVYPPLAAVAEGRGDCDTKTALMASILLNWDAAKLIGVGIPNHYLIGVLRTPAKGDAFVEYGGLSYVLMEPSGPGWSPPGKISDYTLEVLKAGNEIALDPLQKN